MILDIATAPNRRSTKWKNTKIDWEKLAERLGKTVRTGETVKEYRSMPKTRQDDIKDVGGFVGGYLDKGKRSPSTVRHRQLITLDIDFGKQGVFEYFTLFYDCEALVYSTHKHTSETQRLRLVVPLDRPVTSDEYEAIARKIASDIDIELFGNKKGV